MPATNANKSAIDRESVLAAALAVADAHGFEHLTIRKLAAALGVTPMAIYRHVRNKADIADNLLDYVIGLYKVTAHVHPDRRAWICQSFLNMQRALVAHPGLLPLLGTTGSSGWHALIVTEEVLTALRELGLSPEAAARTFYSLISYTVGSAALAAGSRRQQLAVGESDDREWERRSAALLQAMPKSRFPSVVAAASELVMRPSDAQFLAGLRLILAGLPADVQ